MERSLQLYLTLLTAVEGRDEEGLRQVLRAVATELEEPEQHRVMIQLKENLDTQGRALLERMR